MPFFKTQRGINWHYEVTGSGDPIVMIHGLGGSGNFWEAQKEFLRADFTVVTIDLPGHGQSSWMPVNFVEMAVDLRQILSHLGLGPFSLVASSMGGLVALELYRMMPQEIMRISFVGSIPKFARGPNYPAGLDLVKIQGLSLMFDADYQGMLDAFFRSLFSMKDRQTERFKWVREMRKAEALPDKGALKHFLDLLERVDLRDRISSVICPLQFITGTEDYICPRAIMDWVAEHTYNARFDFLEGCGHLPFLTDTKEYNRLLEDFLLN
jgi:pimeloyl-[acyl-carrier protein] methyl ester esterase